MSTQLICTKQEALKHRLRANQHVKYTISPPPIIPIPKFTHIMHTDWINYLKTLKFSSQLPADSTATIAPLTHLSILTVAGSDAATFLQGQTTCDIMALEQNKSSLGAYCNAKGRTITNFIIIKQTDYFQLVFSHELIETVRKKLQMYILRSDVQLTNQTENLCLIGIHQANLSSQDAVYEYPQLNTGQLFIGSFEQSHAFCQALIEQGITLVADKTWLNLDIEAGIPWVMDATSEDFVPQMLNLDTLGAISFEKGCYTGQEIVARTHYLGKNKRAMYYACCAVEVDIEPGCVISELGKENTHLGSVILAATKKTETQLLIVLKDQAKTVQSLQLNNQNHDQINIT